MKALEENVSKIHFKKGRFRSDLQSLMDRNHLHFIRFFFMFDIRHAKKVRLSLSSFYSTHAYSFGFHFLGVKVVFLDFLTHLYILFKNKKRS